MHSATQWNSSMCLLKILITSLISSMHDPWPDVLQFGSEEEETAHFCEQFSKAIGTHGQCDSYRACTSRILILWQQMLLLPETVDLSISNILVDWFSATFKLTRTLKMINRSRYYFGYHTSDQYHDPVPKLEWSRKRSRPQPRLTEISPEKGWRTTFLSRWVSKA